VAKSIAAAFWASNKIRYKEDLSFDEWVLRIIMVAKNPF
jgi:hypothetical protein